MSNMNSQVDFFRSNMRINDNVLHASLTHNVTKVVSMMTTCVFPEDTKYPCDETVVIIILKSFLKQAFDYKKS